MAPEAKQLAGIYLLTPDVRSRAFETVLNVVQQSLDAGVRAIQYRDKTAGASTAPRSGEPTCGDDSRRGCAIDR